MNSSTSVASRREFLRAAVAAPAALALSCARTDRTDDPAKRTGVVDGHLHCFAGPDDARFPYHARAPYRPDAAATPEHLLECMNGAGVDHAIVVHPEPYQDDHRYLEHCLEVGQGRLKGTILVFADRPGSMKKLPGLVQRADVVATRVHAYAPDRLPPFGKPELRELWKLAADNGVAVQLHFEPRYAPGFEPLIREFPDTTVIIDHLGRPLQGTPEEHAVVLGWARYGNTVIKYSAVPRARQYPHRDIQPVIDQIVAAYGPDRMVYGGGFNAEATGASYREERERTSAYLAALSDDDWAKVYGGNAARLFGWS